MSKKDSTSFLDFTRQVLRAMSLVAAVTTFMVVAGGLVTTELAGHEVSLRQYVGIIAGMGIFILAMTIVPSAFIIPFYPVYTAGLRSLTHAGIAVAALSFLAGIGTSVLGYRG